MPVKRGVAANRQAPVASRGKPTVPVAAPVGRGEAKRPAAPPPLRGGPGTRGRGGAARAVAGTQPKGTPVTQKVESASEQQIKPKQQTQQDAMAIRIQTFVRAFLSRRRLLRLREKQLEYNQLMDKLQQEAFLHLVLLEREEAERQAELLDRERRRKLEIQRRKKRMLEAAFEGDTDEIKNILNEAREQQLSAGGATDPHLLRRVELSLVECSDANGNSPLSEAATGGSVGAIALLLELGADLNSVGQYGRTPLYRSAFAGHKSVCEYLLGQGADPRVYAEDGALPQHIASNEELERVLSEWDIRETERLMAALSEREQERRDIDAAHKQEEKDQMLKGIEELEKEYNARQLELSKAHQELEKRICEHDTLLAEGHDRSDLTLPAIQDAEGDLEVAKLHSEQASQKLQAARIELREGVEEEAGTAAGVGVKANIRELDEILMRDVGNKIRDSGRWPLIIDPSGQVSIFLKYRDTNYIDMFIPKYTQTDTVRLALLGAIRFGKMLVIDMRDVDMWHQVDVMFEQIQPGLLASLLSREFLQDEKYLSLVKPEDEEEYQKVNFMHGRVHKFCIAVLTKIAYPPDALLDILYPISIVLPQ